MRRLIALIALATVITATTSPVMANVITRKDGNDTRGPLDLAAVQVSHATGGHVFKMITLAPFTNTEANAKNGFFLVLLDTNADRRPNYLIDVFFAAGHFLGVLFKPSGTVLTYRLKAVRVSSKAVEVTLPLSKIAQKGSYDFAALSFYRASPCSKQSPCVDAIPNRFPLIRHDYTPPRIIWGSVPTYSSDASATLTFPAPFSVHDDIYGSGVKSWTLQRRAVGTSVWVGVKTGAALNPTVQVVGEEGTTYDLRIVVVDRQKNKSVSTTKRTSVPYDDRNLLFGYSSSVQNDGVPEAFQGTTSSVPQTGTITFTMPFDASDVCIVGGPTTGSVANASFSAGGGILSEDGSTAARAHSCVGVSVSSGTMVTFTVSSAEPFVFDGIILVP
jgi:hypothetical protein